MKLNQLASKPQLVKLTIDDESTVKEFGEPIEFYTWDRQPLDVFIRLANSNGTDPGAMVDVLRTMILDENGKQIIVGETMIPTRVLMSAMTRITDMLGK